MKDAIATARDYGRFYVKSSVDVRALMSVLVAITLVMARPADAGLNTKGRGVAVVAAVCSVLLLGGNIQKNYWSVHDPNHNPFEQVVNHRPGRDRNAVAALMAKALNKKLGGPANAKEKNPPSSYERSIQDFYKHYQSYSLDQLKKLVSISTRNQSYTAGFINLDGFNGWFESTRNSDCTEDYKVSAFSSNIVLFRGRFEPVEKGDSNCDEVIVTASALSPGAL